ncbi:tyrosine-type recombinase/integrase [Helicobacter cappadocius]|uniref:Tyrosine recombinase XerH n=1 Tax=Helicobacter cappadocius TaxID=3063998 RepID=A0AA90PR75_9HELI|nr:MULTISPECIES: tyrosine-type recombinase/integrase [unclassified Helicobacter]MDO7252779.1 tyrosine-type recombinase/integrase [Helicobacter sp. faydin-H75]MDP2538647.1 tyrosine-type recombinase/integrase [Helicobacter sp. faydin-H76]
MRYSLEAEGFANDLLFWCSRFIRHKITTLSNRNVKDKECVRDALFKIDKIKNISELETICKNVRNAGLIGIGTYASPVIKLYEHFVSKNIFTSMKEIDEESLIDFLTIYTSNLSVASKKNYRIALIGLFGYIDKQNRDNTGISYVYNIELKNIGGTRGKSGQKLPTYMNESELEKFFRGIECFKMSPKIASRNRLIIKMIIYTGIRVSEALNLRLKDITLENDVYLLSIRGKGDKYRMVMIRKKNIEILLKDWLSIRNTIKDIENNLLFCNQKGAALSQAYIYKNVENILMSAGIRKEKNGAHMLRHSFATLLYQKHQDLVLVQEALGHADLNTTRIYTHFDKKRLLEAANTMEDIPKDMEDIPED